jgi:hypothetical protein
MFLRAHPCPSVHMRQGEGRAGSGELSVSTREGAGQEERACRACKEGLEGMHLQCGHAFAVRCRMQVQDVESGGCSL